MGRLVKLFISFIYFLFDSFFYFIKALWGKKKARCLVLMFHDVTPRYRRAFVRQLDMIKKYTTPIKARQGAVPSGGGRCTAITFDDAFFCLMENVVPEMDKRDLPWTLFVPTAYMGKRPGWEYWGDESENYSIMTPEVLSRLAENPLVTLGSHSVNHSRFSELSPEERQREFRESKEVLDKLTGGDIKSFAFPFGDCNREIIREAREAGYESVFTILPVYTTLEGEPDGSGRIQVDPTDWPFEFFLKLMGAYRWLPLAFGLKRALKSLFSGRK